MPEQCLIFHPIYQSRVWGGRELARVFRRNLPDSGPIGESWELVDRPEAQSVVSDGAFRGRTLHELWTNHRAEIFGEGLHYPRFPLLFKILDAADALSVQVHPPISVAEQLKGEPKTELWYFVATHPTAAIYAGLQPGVTRETFRQALEDGTVPRLLHRLATTSGDYILIPSGRLHAIDAGNVIFEIQQNSDTTYRVFDWNRTGIDGRMRELHLEESLQSIDFNDSKPALSTVGEELLVQCEHFRVECWDLAAKRLAQDNHHFAVFQCVCGSLSLGDRSFHSGDLFLVPASASSPMLEPNENGTRILKTTLGEP